MKNLYFLFLVTAFLFSLVSFSQSQNISLEKFFPSYTTYNFLGNDMNMFIISSNTNFEIYTNQVIIIGRGKTNFSIQVVSNTIITTVTNINQEMVPRPPLSASRIAGEGFVSLSGAVLPWGIFFYFYTSKTDPADKANVTIYTAPAIALSLALSSLGTYIIGNSGDETGEYFNGALTGSLSGLLGGVFAGSIGSLVILTSESIPKDNRSTYATIVFAASASICETAGSIFLFNRTRSYKKQAMPAFYILPEYSNGKFSLKYGLKLITLSF